MAIIRVCNNGEQQIEGTIDYMPLVILKNNLTFLYQLKGKQNDNIIK